MLVDERERKTSAYQDLIEVEKGMENILEKRKGYAVKDLESVYDSKVCKDWLKDIKEQEMHNKLEKHRILCVESIRVDNLEDAREWIITLAKKINSIIAEYDKKEKKERK